MGVLGMGGLFFRAKDPQALSAWYEKHLDVGAGCVADGVDEDVDELVWTIGGGPMVFQPFPADSDYFPADKAFMINLRVSGLDSMLDKLRAAGIEVITKAEWDDMGMGRFARIHDPEGNTVELWEQAGG